MRLFVLFVLRQLLQKPLRVVFAVLGVGLGIALFVAITMINRATLDYFKDTVTSISGTSKLAVTGDETGFPEEVLEKVDRLPDVAHAAPSLEIRARYTTKDGRDETVIVLGIDLLRETGVRAYKADEEIVEDPLAFLNQEDSIIVTRPFAQENGLVNGSTFTLASASGPKKLVVRGILTPEGAAKAYGGRVAIMDIDGARVMFGRENLTDRIDVVPKDGVSEKDLAEALEKAVGPGLRVERPETQAKTFERMVASQQVLLSMTSTLALVIAIFLIANTMAVSVAERRKDIGVVRAVGGSRARVLSLFLGEALLVGAAGSALGVLGGRALATQMVGAVSKSLSTQLVTPIEVGTVSLRGSDVVGAFVVGITSALVAAAWPAWGATRITPVEALAPKDATEDGVGPSRAAILRALVGAALLALLGVLAATGADAKPPLSKMTGGIAIVGFALLAPQLSLLLVAAVRGLAVRLPAKLSIVRFAIENLLAHRRRTAASVLSLVIGLSLVVVNATVQESFRRALLDAVDRSLVGDAFVSTKGRFLSATVQPMREDTARAIDEALAIPPHGPDDALGARAMRFSFVAQGSARIAIKAWDRMPASRSPFLMAEGSADAAERALHGSPPEALVSENYAAHFGVKKGDTVTLASPRGPLTLKVAGTVVDYASPEGCVYLAREVYAKQWGDALVTVFFVFAPKGMTGDGLRRALDDKLGSRGLVTSLVSDVRASTEELLDQSFAYSRSIEFAALLVGLLGLLNTVFINVLERTRELGMLRAIGLSKAGLRAMIVLETTVLGTAAAVSAAVLASYLAQVWLGGSLSTTLGWSVPIHLPAGALVRALGAGVVVGVIAGLAAARRAASLSVPAALANE